MKKVMLMAVAVMASLAANAQTTPEAKAIKKCKTYAEAEQAFKAAEASLPDEDKAFCYNKMAELAAKENTKLETEYITAQMKKDEATMASVGAEKNKLAYAAIDNAQKAFAINPKTMKVGGSLATLRNSLVQAGLDSYNSKDYAYAQKYFGSYVEARGSELFNYAKVDFSKDQNFDQICYYAGLAAYFNKDQQTCVKYVDEALKANPAEPNDIINLKMGALDNIAQADKDTTKYINAVKALYEAYPDNETVFGKLVGLYDEAGQKDAANSLLQSRLAAKPNDPMANAYVGQNAQSDGKYDEAIAAYTKALEGKPDFIQAKLNLGVCYLNRAAGSIDANTDARGNIKPDSKDGIIADLNKAKSVLEEVKAADPDQMQVKWAYPLERVQYALDNVK